MAKILSPRVNTKLDWFSRPDPSHLVQFYPFTSELVSSLLDYISEGLRNGDTCIVIATDRHTRKLTTALDKAGIDTVAALASGQFEVLNAEETLATFMVDGLPDYERFLTAVGRIVSLAAGRGKPIRAFGEMVALLWREGNLDGVIKLEELWNDIARTNAFSLFCAYPEIHFDGSKQHREVIEKIRNCHTLATGSFC